MDKLRFCCNYCPASFPQVKQLFEHYEAEHSNREFKRYQVKHIPSGERGMATAPTPEQACARLCWGIEDCEVREITNEDLEKWRVGIHREYFKRTQAPMKPEREE